jgi:hypothetical protein
MKDSFLSLRLSAELARLLAAELAARWETLPRLSTDEADKFAADVAAGREAMLALRPAWDLSSIRPCSLPPSDAPSK